MQACFLVETHQETISNQLSMAFYWKNEWIEMVESNLNSIIWEENLTMITKLSKPIFVE